MAIKNSEYKTNTISVMPRAGRAIVKVISALSSVSNLVATSMVMLMMFLISADVFGRFFFNKPVAVTVAACEAMLVVTVFLGLAYTQARGGHVRVEILRNRFPSKGKTIVDIIAQFAGLVLFALIAWKSGETALESWYIKEWSAGIIPFPNYPVKATVSLGAFLMCLQFIVGISRSFTELRLILKHEEHL